MKLIILGSGTSIPSRTRQASGFVVKIGKEILLFDSGEGTKRRLMEAAIHPNNIDYILYSHVHVDHFVELVALMWGYCLPEQTRKNNLTIIGPQGLKKFSKEVEKLFFPGMLKKVAKFKLKIIEVKNSKFKTKNWQIESIPVGSSIFTPVPLSLGYRLKVKNKILAYTGDSGPDKNLIKIAKNANLFISEASVPNPSFGHLAPSQAGEIAQKARVKKLLLTHFYPSVEKIDIKKQARKYYKGPIILAKDLMEINI